METSGLLVAEQDHEALVRLFEVGHSIVEALDLGSEFVVVVGGCVRFVRTSAHRRTHTFDLFERDLPHAGDLLGVKRPGFEPFADGGFAQTGYPGGFAGGNGVGHGCNLQRARFANVRTVCALDTTGVRVRFIVATVALTGVIRRLDMLHTRTWLVGGLGVLFVLFSCGGESPTETAEYKELERELARAQEALDIAQERLAGSLP